MLLQIQFFYMVKFRIVIFLNRHQSKQFITEEKMTAHFKSLRISSIHEAESPVPSTSASSSSSRQLDMDLDVDGRNTINGEQLTGVHPRLVLSEELKRMQEEPILPTTLLSKL